MLTKLKPVAREAAVIVGEAGKEKVREYGPRTVAAVKGLASETQGLSGRERKKAMKGLVLDKVKAPALVKWGLSPLAERAVDVIVDFVDLHDCIRMADSTPEKRREASAAILDRLGTPFYLKWAARRVVGSALDVVVEYREFFAFLQPQETSVPSLAEETPEPEAYTCPSPE